MADLFVEDPIEADDTLRHHWEALSSTGSRSAREAIFVHYMKYARSLAAQIYGKIVKHDVEFNDLLQFAYLGLLESIDRFDPSRGVHFRTYCTHRIRGSLLSGLGQASEVRQQVSFERRMRKERLLSLKAEDQGAVEEKLSRMAAGMIIGFMLEGTGMCEPAPGAVPAFATGYDSQAWYETKEQLYWSLSSLPENARKVIQYHYFDFLPFERIATLLGLSRGRVSQLHRAAIDHLRVTLRSQDFASLKT